MGNGLRFEDEPAEVRADVKEAARVELTYRRHDLTMLQAMGGDVSDRLERNARALAAVERLP